MQRVTWILSLLWNQMMILSLEEKTCEASNWISFTYYLFWGGFWSKWWTREELRVAGCLLCVPVPSWADASGKSGKTFSKLFSVIPAPFCFTVNFLCNSYRSENNATVHGKMRTNFAIPLLCHGSVLHIRWECSCIVRKDYNVCILRKISVCVIE